MLNRFYAYRIWILGLLVTTVLVGAAAGSYYYIQYKQRESHLLKAAHAYTQLLNSEEAASSPLSPDKAMIFIRQHSSTPYATLVQLTLAKHFVEHKQLQEAAQILREAAQSAIDPDIGHIARQRCARVLVALGKPQDALQLLDEETEKTYIASNQEIKGDILKALDQKEKALKAYYQAYEKNPHLAEIKPILPAKIIDLETA